VSGQIDPRHADAEVHQDSRGNALTPVPTPETKPPSLASVYALSKYDQERLSILIGRALLKQVGLRARLEQAHAVGDWSTPEGAAAGAMLQRLGYITHAVSVGASPVVLDQMIAEGRATRARGNLLDHKPHPPIPGKSLSEILTEMRRDERRDVTKS